jgi:hypothetical protein
MKIVTLATLHLGVRQTGGLVAEQQRHLPLAGPRQHVSGGLTRLQRRRPEIAVPRRNGVGKHAVGQRRVEAAAHLCLRENVVGSGRARHRLVVGKRFGLTRDRRDRPIVFIARAAAPMLPG